MLFEPEYVLIMMASIVLFWTLAISGRYLLTSFVDADAKISLSEADSCKYYLLIPTTVHSVVVSFVVASGLYYQSDLLILHPFTLPSGWISQLLAFSIGFYIVMFGFQWMYETTSPGSYAQRDLLIWVVLLHDALCIFAFGFCLAYQYALFFAAVRLLSQIADMFWSLRTFLVLSPTYKSTHVWLINILTIMSAVSVIFTEVILIKKCYEIARLDQLTNAYFSSTTLQRGFWDVNAAFDCMNAFFMAYVVLFRKTN